MSIEFRSWLVLTYYQNWWKSVLLCVPSWVVAGHKLCTLWDTKTSFVAHWTFQSGWYCCYSIKNYLLLLTICPIRLFWGDDQTSSLSQLFSLCSACLWLFSRCPSLSWRWFESIQVSILAQAATNSKQCKLGREYRSVCWTNGTGISDRCVLHWMWFNLCPTLLFKLLIL